MWDVGRPRIPSLQEGWVPTGSSGGSGLIASGSGLATALAGLNGPDAAAAIEVNGGKPACLSGSASHGQGSGNSGQPSFTAPSSGAAATMTIVGEVRKAVQDGTPLAQLAMDCDAAHVTGNPGGGQGQPT